MADLKGTYNITSYHPNVRWVVDYSQTGRTSTTATYKFTVTMALTTGLSYGYGYDVYLHLSQGGSSKVSRHRLKTTANTGTSWSTSFNVTLNTDSSGGSIPSVRLWSSSDTDSTHYMQQIDITGEVTKTVFGTRPTAPTNVTASGVYENGEKIKISWSAVSGASIYEIEHSQYNTSTGWTTWTTTQKNITTTSYTYTVNTIGANINKIKFRVWSWNSLGWSTTGTETNEVLRSGLKVWNGSFTRGIVRVWNGSSWVIGRVRVWNGSSWVNSK